MSAQPEALRLADLLCKDGHECCDFQAAAELRRLHADAEESEALRERLSDLLRNTAIALRGPEPELTRWSWHDLPELATALKAQRDALLERADTLQRWYDQQLDRLATVEAQRDALLEALKLARLMLIAHGESHAKIDAAIKAVEEQK